MAGQRLRVGDVLGGRYELLGVLGEGGQSILFRARDRPDGDEVAVKVLRSGTGDRDAVERMFREAHAMMEPAATAAVCVLRQRPAPDGSMALVMELLHGRERTSLLNEIHSAGRRMSFGQMTQIFEPVVVTLERAREKGI